MVTHIYEMHCVCVCVCGYQTFISELESHSFGLVPHQSKKLSKFTHTHNLDNVIFNNVVNVYVLKRKKKQVVEINLFHYSYMFPLYSLRYLKL